MIGTKRPKITKSRIQEFARADDDYSQLLYGLQYPVISSMGLWLPQEAIYYRKKFKHDIFLLN